MSAKKVADALSGVLADTYVLFTKTQNYHWNVVGPQFHSLHLLFEGQYNELFIAIDEIAERIRQVGASAPGTMAEFLRLTVLSESSVTSAAAMVADLAACNEKTSSRAQACLQIAEDAGDDGTVDLMVRRLNAHAKADWMLRATLGDEPVDMPVTTAAAAVASKPTKVAKAAKPAKAVKAVKVAKPAKTVKSAKVAKPVKAEKKVKAKPVAIPVPKVIAAPKPVAEKPAKAVVAKAKPAKVAKAPKAAKAPVASKKKSKVALG